MLRELSEVLLDLHGAIEPFAAQARAAGLPITLSGLELTLPLDMQPVFRDGRCVLLADVARSRHPHDWTAQPAALQLAWVQVPTAPPPESAP
ncbi:hypothetical protein [uncultured Thiodictyon sp.]|uniref:hypothetical protein n=1 Tax=uncultured Thiodictyon sp. TaxID=1846217 RepID=UPI0025FEDE23|nr:hypothetical protein [uncultured Thiodictyon sp.]